MIIEASQLQPGDEVQGYGTVSSVRQHHHPSCPDNAKCHNSCSPVDRVIVRFDSDASEYVFHGITDLEVHRAAQQPEYQPHLQALREDPDEDEPIWAARDRSGSSPSEPPAPELAGDSRDVCAECGRDFTRALSDWCSDECATAAARSGTCGHEIRHLDGTFGFCAQKPGHLDRCRSRKQLDAKNAARGSRR